MDLLGSYFRQTVKQNTTKHAKRGSVRPFIDNQENKNSEIKD